MNYLPLIAQIETAMKAVDHAAQQSLQWFLIAAVAVIIFFAWLVIRWLVRWVEKRAAADENYAELRMKMIHENTEMLREVRGMLRQVKHLLLHGPGIPYPNDHE